MAEGTSESTENDYYSVFYSPVGSVSEASEYDSVPVRDSADTIPRGPSHWGSTNTLPSECFSLGIQG